MPPQSMTPIQFSGILERKQRSKGGFTQFWFDQEGLIKTENVMAYSGKGSRAVVFHLRAHVPFQDASGASLDTKGFLDSLYAGQIYLGVVCTHNQLQSETEPPNQQMHSQQLTFPDLNLEYVARVCKAKKKKKSRSSKKSRVSKGEIAPPMQVVSVNPDGGVDIQTKNYFQFGRHLKTVTEQESVNALHYSFALFKRDGKTELLTRVSDLLGRFTLIKWHSRGKRHFTYEDLETLATGPIDLERYEKSMKTVHEEKEKRKHEQQKPAPCKKRKRKTRSTSRKKKVRRQVAPEQQEEQVTPQVSPESQNQHAVTIQSEVSNFVSHSTSLPIHTTLNSSMAWSGSPTPMFEYAQNTLVDQYHYPAYSFPWNSSTARLQDLGME